MADWLRDWLTDWLWCEGGDEFREMKKIEIFSSFDVVDLPP